MIKSPLRYPGGKSKAIKHISPLIPSFHEFREPFVGGGSVFVYLKQMYPEKSFWINDIYTNLYHFWTHCQKTPSDLINQIKKWKNEYSDGKSLHRYLLDNIENFYELEKAAAFFIFNRITFSGTTESGGFSKQAFEKRFTESSIDRVEKLSSIMGGTTITNLDYQRLLGDKGDSVFIFLDPPYFSATKSALYGKNGNLHKAFDHERFSSALKNCTHNWLITYDDDPFIRELFSDANIIEWDMQYGMRNVNPNRSQIGKELFISNYSVKQTKSGQLGLI